LLEHGWPGNVRELRNVVEYAFAVGRGTRLVCEDLPPELRQRARAPAPPSAAAAGQQPEASAERAAIVQALAETGGHVGRAAQRLGISRPTLWRKRKKLGI